MSVSSHNFINSYSAYAYRKKNLISTSLKIKFEDVANLINPYKTNTYRFFSKIKTENILLFLKIKQHVANWLCNPMIAKSLKPRLSDNFLV